MIFHEHFLTYNYLKRAWVRRRGWDFEHNIEE